MHAYDIEMLTRPADRADPGCHGWCFGLPPGIAPEQWPLDRNTGYPLQHGFTLLLPEDYRVHGPELVALSFFATAQNEGGTPEVPGIRGMLEQPGAEPPPDPDLVAFWRSGRAAHPRLHRMVDILDCDYAAILLTRDEFDGPLCKPPLLDSALLQRTDAPPWLTIGSAAAFWNVQHPPSFGTPSEEQYIYRALGGVPKEDLSYDRALRWTPRANDPNAGVPPCDSYIGEPTGYQQPDYFLDDKPVRENYRKHAWAEGHARNHIGGTMRPVQATPRFSPYYVEFDEELGGYNFGCGNAQLDFRDMRFDWACG